MRLILFLSVVILTACSRVVSPADSQPSPAATVEAAAAPAQNASAYEPLMPERVQAAFERTCKSCHGPEGQGIKGVAPDLRSSRRRNLQEWTNYLKDDKGVHSQSRIPAMSNLEDLDYEAIGGYLADLTQANPLPGTK